MSGIGWGSPLLLDRIDSLWAELCGPRHCPHPTLCRHNRGCVLAPKRCLFQGLRERQDGGREVSALVDEERRGQSKFDPCLMCPFQGEEKSPDVFLLY